MPFEPLSAKGRMRPRIALPFEEEAQSRGGRKGQDALGRERSGALCGERAELFLDRRLVIIPTPFLRKSGEVRSE